LKNNHCFKASQEYFVQAASLGDAAFFVIRNPFAPSGSKNLLSQYKGEGLFTGFKTDYLHLLPANQILPSRSGAVPKG